VIIYYSGWLQKRVPGSPLDFGISDLDKNGLLSVTHDLDATIGLDLLLHTPGGDMAATESLIDFLRQTFGRDIRAIIPQIAMSGGSMIACACREILMGAQSNIGPFDPQVNGVPAQAIKAEFDRAGAEIRGDQLRAFVWQPVLQKLPLGFITQIEQAIQMADTVVTQNLTDCMFYNEANASTIAQIIVSTLGSHAQTGMHARHIHRDRARALGLKITNLEDNPQLNEEVMAIHHASMITFEQTPAFKIIENHEGSSFIHAQNLLMVPGSIPASPGRGEF
jgi:hypothetical protein